MTHFSPRELPTWLVIGTAIVVPILLVIIFGVAMDAGRLPNSEFLRDPNAGYTQASTNDAIVFLYIVGEIVFLIMTPLLVTRRPGLRAAFWAIAIPLCMLLSLIATVGQMAG